MNLPLFLVPIIGWFIAVIIKFTINAIFHQRYSVALALSNGGFPSVHTTTVISAASYIGFIDGFNSTTFMLAETMAFIVITDATHLRRSIGLHARILKKLSGNQQLHECEGHTYYQVAAGIILGFIVGFILSNYR